MGVRRPTGIRILRDLNRSQLSFNFIERQFQGELPLFFSLCVFLLNRLKPAQVAWKDMEQRRWCHNGSLLLKYAFHLYERNSRLTSNFYFQLKKDFLLPSAERTESHPASKKKSANAISPKLKTGYNLHSCLSFFS